MENNHIRRQEKKYEDLEHKGNARKNKRKKKMNRTNKKKREKTDGSEQPGLSRGGAWKVQCG